MLSFDPYNIILTLLISFAIQMVFFSLAAIYKTDKVTDLSYGLSFVIISHLLLVVNGTYYGYQIIIALLITIWGIRLAIYLFYRILKMGKDDRFDGIRENLVKFAGFWFFQAITIWIVITPASIALSMNSDISIGYLSVFGILIWLVGLIIESIADWQKFQFKSIAGNKGAWIESGIWKYSRHPNYFGEILCWIGLFLIAIPILSGWLWLSIIGPAYITFLLLYVSGIPTLERKYDEVFAENAKYLEYKRKTSLIIPLPKRT